MSFDEIANASWRAVTCATRGTAPPTNCEPRCWMMRALSATPGNCFTGRMRAAPISGAWNPSRVRRLPCVSTAVRTGANGPSHWPKHESPASRRHPSAKNDAMTHAERNPSQSDIMLDLSKLENVRQVGGKLTARCPACHEAGGDRGGHHLACWPESGKFACAARPGDKPHRQRIWQLAGLAKPSGLPSRLTSQSIQKRRQAAAHARHNAALASALDAKRRASSPSTGIPPTSGMSRLPLWTASCQNGIRY